MQLQQKLFAVSYRISLIIDVCTDIYVMMSSDLYETCRCRHCLYRTLSHTCRRNCNKFGNVATITASCKTLHWRTMQTSFTVSVISFIILCVKPEKLKAGHTISINRKITRHCSVQRNSVHSYCSLLIKTS